jgi:hypothetical protein
MLGFCFFIALMGFFLEDGGIILFALILGACTYNG